ncbi:LysR family transcriptional regulator [Microbacteriaceae bacterium VKM Ac-2854]|nr:LysR family transcriptional regulator [Microbacteriaceae bacterium VKM Ac-2854]
MDQRQLEYFVAVAEELSFTRAAARLFVVQSTLSAAIKSLEAELGAALFIRSTRRVELTGTGEALYPEALAAIEALNRLRSTAADSTAGLRGRVRVGILSSIGVVDLPRLLGEFHRRHPLVDLVLSASVSGSTGLLVDLRRGRIDIAVLGLPASELADLDTVTIAHSGFVALVPPEHPLAGRNEVGLDEVSHEPFIDTLPGFGNRIAVDQAFEHAGLRRRVTTEIGDLQTVPPFVAAGLGIAIVPEVMLERSDAVVALPLRGSPIDWTLSMGGLDRAEHSPAVAAFLALLHEQTGTYWPIAEVG